MCKNTYLCAQIRKKMKIGDRVRFLDTQGGGIVKGFNSNGLVMVEDEDGFEIPTMASQCVVVSQEDDDRQAGHAPVHQAPLTRAQKAAREAMTEVDKLKEENGQLKARIHELENEMNNLKLQLLKAQYQSAEQQKQGKGGVHQAIKTNPYEVLRNGIIEVDLHINQLVDSTAGMNNADMLRHQLHIFRQTMDSYKHAKGQKIVFIHGKGEGVLRKAIIDELKLHYPKCDYQDASFQQYGFGATMVTVH